MIVSLALKPPRFSLMVMCICVALIAIVIVFTVRRSTPPFLYDGIEFEVRDELVPHPTGR